MRLLVHLADFLDAEDLRNVLADYGGTFIDLPEEAFEFGGAISLDTDEEAWAVDLDLWTAEEGRSDLTLPMTVRNTNEGIVIEIDDLHVL